MIALVPGCCPTGTTTSYVWWTLAGLLAAHEAPQRRGDAWHLDGWTVAVRDRVVDLQQTGDDRDAGLRAVVSAAWDWFDRSGEAPEPALDLTAALRGLHVT